MRIPGWMVGVRRSACTALAAALLSHVALAEDTPADQYRAAVEVFVAAFNQRDLEAIGKAVTDDIEWLSVDGAAVSVETASRQALVEALGSYFASCTSCRSELAQVLVSKERVVAVEVASWDSQDGPASQRSVSVYEFDGDLIRRVYYFPAEP